MTLDQVTFFALAVLLVGSALAVVLSKNLFHSVLWLALALTGTAGIFLMLEAEFIAAVQILLYAGGVITMVVFAIVVTERLIGTHLSQTSRSVVRGLFVSSTFLVLMLDWLVRKPLPYVHAEVTGDATKAIGSLVLTRFVLPFELLAVVLLVALVGASYFARPEE
jgi:NADH:ubiquinone oxidoreductase subunit 6 (subunit J)